MRDERFNIVYVDRERGYAGVKRDLEVAIQVLADGGVLCGDNLEVQTHHQPAPGAFSNLRDSLDAVEPGTSTTFLPGVTASVDEAFDPVKSQNGFWQVRRRADAFEGVTFAPVNVKPPAHVPERLRPYFVYHPAMLLAVSDGACD